MATLVGWIRRLESAGYPKQLKVTEDELSEVKHLLDTHWADTPDSALIYENYYPVTDVVKLKGTTLVT